VLFYLQVAPLMLGWSVTRLLNNYYLQPRKQILSIREITVMLLGGRFNFRNIEYVSPNIHLKCLEVSVTVKWWRGATDIRQGPSPTKIMPAAVWQALPFRMSIAVAGLDISVYNNTERYGGLEEYILRAIYRHVFGRDPPGPDAGAAASSPAKPASGQVASSWERARRFIARPFASKHQVDLASAQTKDLGGRESPRGSAAAASPANLRDPLPRFYSLFPITHILFTETVIYVGAPTLPTTLIVCTRRAAGQHYASPIAPDALNRELDSYSIVNSFDMRGVSVTVKVGFRCCVPTKLACCVLAPLMPATHARTHAHTQPNPGYVAVDELQGGDLPAAKLRAHFGINTANGAQPSGPGWSATTTCTRATRSRK
jgi:hypothetical protein